LRGITLKKMVRKNFVFFKKCIKYSQLYSQCVIMAMLGIKVGKRMMIYEY